MSIYYAADVDIEDFDTMVLLQEERKLLRQIARRSGIKLERSQSVANLAAFGLIQPVPTGKLDRYGNCIYDSNWEVTVKYHRYGKYQRKCTFQKIINSVIIPIIVSVITSIIVRLVLCF